MTIDPPNIVGKDVHPWMGYVDVMGTVFRPAGGVTEAVASIRTLRMNQKVVPMDYRQDHMEAVSTAIQLSGQSPLQSLLLLASLEDARLEGYSRVISGLVKDCLQRLSDTEFMSLHENLERILARQPECHTSAEWICCQVPEELYRDPQHRPSLRLLALTNHLQSLNHQGRSSEAFEMVPTGEALSGEVKASGLRLRFFREVADAFGGALMMDSCHCILDRHLEECWDKVADVSGAMRFISYRLQVLGFTGETEKALECSERVFPYLMTRADEDRQRIYSGHLLVDLGRYEEAWEDLISHRGSEEDLLQWAMGSRFCMALVLKLESHAPRLERSAKKALLQKDPERGFPWMNIAYWGLQLDFTEQRRAQRLAKLILNLTEPTQSASMEVVRYCIWSQLVADGDVDGQMNFDLRFDATKQWLLQHPMQPDEPRGMLKPLFFYYL